MQQTDKGALSLEWCAHCGCVAVVTRTKVTRSGNTGNGVNGLAHTNEGGTLPLYFRGNDRTREYQTSTPL